MNESTKASGVSLVGRAAANSASMNSESPANAPHLALPSVSLPKGGGAIRGIGEMFAANPVTGTGSMTVPVPVSPSRSGFGPQLSLSYDSGAGNGPFGWGWNLSLPRVTRKTDQGLPQYRDAEESDVFILSGADDLVPVLQSDGRRFDDLTTFPGFIVCRYRSRIEGLFARIERWTNQETGEIHWRSISKDNITTLYGQTSESRIESSATDSEGHRIFSWLICERFDEKGNVVVYRYKPENSDEVSDSLAHEQNRPGSRSTNRHIKSIYYGNRTSRLSAEFDTGVGSDQPLADPNQWMFEVVFDYGEHDREVPQPAGDGTWLGRNDPFSSYRAGFEVRTYRLCQRILMFHHFRDEPGVGDNCLVRSLDIEYRSIRGDAADKQKGHPIATFIASITQKGYKRQPAPATGYLARSLPALEFEYSDADIDEHNVFDIDRQSLENLPTGLSGAYQWVDLDSEGLPGILTDAGGGWYYKRNTAANNLEEIDNQSRAVARLAPVELIKTKPNASLAMGHTQFLDLAGDGLLDLVQFDGPRSGFYERTADGGWDSFRPFHSTPNFDTRDLNVKFVDLDGDGRADILINDNEDFTWHPSLGEAGYGPALQVRKALDDERGPRAVLGDDTQAVFLADMSGDGLADLVRITNGAVCYWPNLGYGRFGARVTMDDSPRFDHPEAFDPRRLRLADIDGSGVTDIIYLADQGVRLYFNQSGNSWAPERRLDLIPQVTNLVDIQVTDLLGNGTACLVWSSPLPNDVNRQMKYVDLMSGRKPHLLTRVVNNLGAETFIHYAPSTKFYLDDKDAGRPWITQLPFPIQVVERVEIFDRLSRNRFVTRYAYHHGYFDGEEREFRGFGMVEQFDTEEFSALSTSGEFPSGDNVDIASHVPPVHSKTWFHTGVYLGRDHISDFFAGLLNDQDGEYYREPGLNNPQARELLLNDTVLPAGLTVEEEREACRALKGAILRQEVYALDGTARSPHPYTVTEQNFTIKMLQERGDNRNGVFFTHPREALTYHYERDPADPRTSHALTLDVDEFGNVLRAAAIGYGRRVPDANLAAADQANQSQVLITYTESRVTNVTDAADDFRTPLPCEMRTYELTGLTLPTDRRRFTLDEVLNAGTGAATIPFEELPTEGLTQKRLIKQDRTLYRPDDLGAAQSDPLALLPLGTVEPLALPGEGYTLAFTSGLLTAVYGAKVSDSMLKSEGRYVHSEGDANWWIPSGRVFFSPKSTDSAAQELSYARSHFFLPLRHRDPFHTTAVSTESFVTYDRCDLLIVDTRDALGNRVTAGERQQNGEIDPSQPGNDYRTLQPRLIMDPNRNRTAVAFDALGMVVGTAVMGKPRPAPVEGDSLEGFEADLTETAILDHFSNPLADPQGILGRATTRLMYDLFAYNRTQDQADPRPAVVYALVRETHDSDLVPPGGLRFQHSFSYSDGFGREIQKKGQTAPGPVPQRDASGKIILNTDGRPVMTTAGVSPRWVGSGWKVFNNKGQPVRQYEPFFTDTQRFEFDVRIGVSSVLFYDPVGRVIATLHANHTWEKLVFDPWRQETWDVNDTLLAADPTTDLDVGDYFNRLADTEYLPTWYAQRQGGGLGPDEQAAAQKGALHAATPAIAHADSLGRAFLTVDHNKFKYSDAAPADPPVEAFHRARIRFDIQGNPLDVIDAADRIIIRYDYDIFGNRIHQSSMEAGERWMLNDVAGNPLYSWDSRNQTFRTAYDALRRPTDSFLRDAANPEIRVGRNIYGETQPDPEAANLRGKAVQIFDQAGVVTKGAYDFKGNLLVSLRQLAQEYHDTLNWSAAVTLQPEIFSSHARFDALDRTTEMTAPDQSVIRQQFNEASRLKRVTANLRGAQQNGQPIWTDFVNDIDYDARGQRVQVDFGNGVTTSYGYDPLTFRLVHLLTRRNAVAFPDDCPQPSAAGWPGCQVQNLSYTYDPVGNITQIRDDAQQSVYFRNRRVEPSAEFTYDATYRLIEATGREHLGQANGNPSPSSYNDRSRTGILFSASDGNALGRYLERYVYDVAGNFQELIHRGSDPSNPGWTRSYVYDEPSLLEPARHCNRLSNTQLGPIAEIYSTGGNGYDPHGNMLHMPQLEIMQWNYKDELQMTQRQAVNADDDEGASHTGERTIYVYDDSGSRVRKLTELASGQLKEERIYLGGFEIYRRHGTDPLVRETLHITAEKQRIAFVETRTQGDDGSPIQLIRYQFGNHLGSASLELDGAAQIISYEEYTPYGSTSYQAVRSQTETAKRYRYTGMERDEESGLSYHTARYYAPWLGSWTSCDPIGIDGGSNLYLYAHNNCIRFSDPGGTDPPSDIVTNVENRTGVIIVTKTVDREGLHSKLVTTFNPATQTVTDRLYRRADYHEQGWTDVTDQALKSPYLNPKGVEVNEGRLSVEWNMPAEPPKVSKVEQIANAVRYAPGEMLVSEIPPSLVIPYVKDSILTEHFEFTPAGENPVQHWYAIPGRRWAATGERKVSFWLNKVVTVAGAGVSAASTYTNAVKAAKGLSTGAARLARSAEIVEDKVKEGLKRIQPDVAKRVAASQAKRGIAKGIVGMGKTVIPAPFNEAELQIIRSLRKAGKTLDEATAQVLELRETAVEVVKQGPNAGGTIRRR